MVYPSELPPLLRAVTRRTLLYALDDPPELIGMYPGGNTTLGIGPQLPARLEVAVVRIEHLTDYRAQGAVVHSTDGGWARSFRRGAPPSGSWANDLPEWLWLLLRDVEVTAHQALTGPVCETCGYRVELSADMVVSSICPSDSRTAS